MLRMIHATALLVALTPICAFAQDTVTVVIQSGPSGPGYATQALTLSSTTPPSGPLVPLSATAPGNNEVRVRNWHPATQLAGFYAAVAAGTARIVTEGDSLTDGAGSAQTGWTETGYPAEMVQAFIAGGVPAQQDDFQGYGGYFTQPSDNRVTLVGGAQVDGNAVDAGGPGFQTINVGDGISFTINSPGNYDRITVNYPDIGTGTLAVAVDGVQVGTMTETATYNTLSKVFPVAAGMHSKATVTQVGSAGAMIEGMAFSSSTVHAIQMFNAGIGGWTTAGGNESYCYTGSQVGQTCGFGLTAGVVALKPSLVLLNLLTNDVLHDTSTTLAGHQSVINAAAANLAQIVANLQAAGSDVIIMLPQPFYASAYKVDIKLARAAIRQIAINANIGMIDLSKTYDDDAATLGADGLLGSDGVHPDATLYADYATSIVTRMLAH